METKEAIKAFIEWAEENSLDAWWIYENADEAADKFIEQYAHSSGDRGRKEWPGQKEMLEFMKEHFWENEEVTQTWDQIVNYTNAVIDWLKTRSGK